MDTVNFLEKLLNGVKVEWKALGELGSFYSGLSGKNKSDFNTGNSKYIPFKNIFYNMEVNTDQILNVKISDNEKQNNVLLGDVLFTGSSENYEESGMSSVLTVNYDKNLYLNSFCFGFRLHDKSILLPHFMKYLFRTNEIRKNIIKTASGVTRFNISKKNLAKIKIPIPCVEDKERSLEIQAKIVSILDSFTELTTELTNELNARKKQYSFYRDQLLSFNEDQVQWLPVAKLFHLKNGYTPSKSKKEFWENGTIPWFRMDDIRTNGKILNNSLQSITKSALKGGNLFPANSIIMATSATIGEHALISVPYLANQRFTNLTVKDEYTEIVNIKYLYYYGFLLADWCKKNTTISSFASVDMDGFRKFKIPIPPIKEQERIVAILDKFDALTNSIQHGLPLEIHLRQKQYLFYLDLLFNFPK